MKDKVIKMGRRVQLDFTDEGYDRLQKVKELAKKQTNAAVIRNGLSLYEWLLEVKEKNGVVIVKYPNGDNEKINFTGLDKPDVSVNELEKPDDGQ